MRMRLLYIPTLLLPVVAQAQTVGQIGQKEATPPYTAAGTISSTDGSGKKLSAPVVIATNADGSAISGGGGGGSSGVAQGSTTSGQSVVPVACAVVTGNQSYTAGTTQPCNLTPTGRLKIGVSSATNVDPATQLTTTLDSDLFGCKYRATPPPWSDGYTGAIRCDATGALVVAGAVTANIGTTNGLALDSSLATLNTTNNSLFKAGQSIGNAGFAAYGSAGTALLQGTGAATANSLNAYIGGGTVAATQGSTPWVDNLTQVGGSAITLGQKTQAASIPVTLASDGSYATAANQNSTAAGTSATNAQAVQGVTGGVAIVTTTTNGALAANQPAVATAGSAAPATGTLLMGSDGTSARPLSVNSVSGVGYLNAFVQGNIGSGATDGGNPLKIGGYASGSAPTAVTAGQRVNAWYGLNGQAIVGGSAGVALLTGSTGVLAAPTAAVVNSTGTVTAVAASTSTTVCPATTNPVVYEVQIYGTAPVLLGLDGQTLSSITPAAGSGAYMLLPTQYTLYVGPVARTNIITAYTATAQTVVCNIVTRQ